MLRRAATRLVAYTIIAIVGSTTAFGQTRSAHFGREWVRSHPFTLSAVVLRPDAAIGKQYIEAGLNTEMVWKNRPALFAWAQSQGIPWHLHIDRRRSHEEMKVEIETAFKTHPRGEGVLIFDEPKRNEMAGIGEIIAWTKETHPDKIVYTNGYPAVRDGESMAKLYGDKWLASALYDEPPVPYSYEDYLSDIATITRPDVLMLDIYPFNELPESDPEWIYHNRYFFVMSTLREVALREEMPYWVFVQTYGKEGYTRVPSESDLRMQVYSSLAFGVTGISYFTYDNVFDTGMLAADYTPSSIYHNAQKLNKEIAHLGKPLRFLTSTDVRYVPGQRTVKGEAQPNPCPRGLGIYHPASRVAAQITGIEINAEGEDKNALIGFFKDDEGKNYFMLVNLHHGKGRSAEAASLPITLGVSPDVKSLVKLSRETGRPEIVPVKDGKVQLTLPGGTGELFRIGPGTFPGTGNDNN